MKKLSKYMKSKFSYLSLFLFILFVIIPIYIFSFSLYIIGGLFIFLIAITQKDFLFLRKNKK